MKNNKWIKIENAISLILVFMLLMLALFISSGKTRILFGVLAAAGFLAGRIFKRKLPFFLAGVGVLFLVLNLFYNFRGLDRNLTFTDYGSQTLYQESDLENQIYPDSLLRLLIKDKKITIPYEVTTYDFYNTNGNEEEREEKFNRRYYRETNYARYFEEYARSCEVDLTMPRLNDVSGNMIEEDFTEYGIANDMLRYSFLLNHEHMKEASYFWYSWYYYSYAEEEGKYAKIFLCKEDLTTADHLAAVWDKRENLYVMSYDYYKRKVVGIHE